VQRDPADRLQAIRRQAKHAAAQADEGNEVTPAKVELQARAHMSQIDLLLRVLPGGRGVLQRSVSYVNEWLQLHEGAEL
jgi:hypothetical protein